MDDGAVGVCVPGVAVAEGDFCGGSTIVDCDEEREKVFAKGAPRWVSFNSGRSQLAVPSSAFTACRILLVSFHDMFVVNAGCEIVAVAQDAGEGEGARPVVCCLCTWVADPLVLSDDDEERGEKGGVRVETSEVKMF